MKKLRLNTNDIILAAAVVVLLLVLVPVQRQIDRLPEKVEAAEFQPFDTLPPADYMVEYVWGTLLGGMKSFVVTYLWVAYGNLSRDKQFDEAITILKLIAKLQPHLEEVWTFLSWEIAYNISAQQTDPEKQWRWVQAGINYAKEGVRHNPKGKRVTWQVGYLYWHRVSQSDYMMAKVKETEGKSAYKCAAEWFEKYNAIVVEKGGRDARDAYEIFPMLARYYSALDDLVSGDVVSARAELEIALKWGKKFEQESLGNEKYWALRVEQLSEIQKMIGGEEKYLLVMRSSASRQEKTAATWCLLQTWLEMQAKFKQLDNDPVIIRMAALLADYVRLGYEAVDSGDVSGGMSVVLKGIGFGRRMGEEMNEDVGHPALMRLSGGMVELGEAAALDAKALKAKGSVENSAWVKMTLDAAEAYATFSRKYPGGPGRVAVERAERLKKLAR